MTARREVWRIDRAGALDRLRRREEPSPDPGPGEVRVRVAAVGLNFADLFACMGLYSATPEGPFTPGLECAGTVSAVGAPAPGRARPFTVGERVMAVTRFGGYATEVAVDARQAHPLPAGWSFAEGAAYPVQALTAWYALLRVGHAGPGKTVLVHSAAGGVGLMALEVLATLGAEAIATVGREEKRAFLVRERGLAPEAVIVRDRRRFGAQLDAALAARNRPGLDLVLDAVLGPFFRPAYDRLRPQGRHVVFGAAEFTPAGGRPDPLRLAARWVRRPRLDPLAMISENRAVMGFNLIWLWEEIDLLAGAFAELTRLVRRRPHVGARFAFARAPEALRHLQSGATTGKVVLEVERGP